MSTRAFCRHAIEHALLRIATAAALVVAVTGCNGGSVTESQPTSESFPDAYPENRGTLVSSFVSLQNSPWWENGEELAYVSPPLPEGTSVYAVQVQGGATRTLDGPRAGSSAPQRLVVAPDGATAYYVSGATQPSLYHLPPGGAAVLVESAAVWGGTSKFSEFGLSVLPASDSRSAVYLVRPDSVRIYDAISRTSRPLGSGCTGLHAFSPDGRRVLCVNSGTYWTVSLEDGSRTLAVLPPRLSSVHGVHWGPDGLQVLSSGAALMMELGNGTTGQVRPLVDVNPFSGRELPNYTRIAWSRDGRRVAFSAGYLCPILGRCPFYQLSVYVADIASRRVERVAVVNAPSGTGSQVGGLAFAPDGNRIAYVVGTLSSAALYVADAR